MISTKERLGIFMKVLDGTSPADKARARAKKENTERINDWWRHILLVHAGTHCTGEVSFLLGNEEYDPHPENLIRVVPKECACEEFTGLDSANLNELISKIPLNKIAYPEEQIA